MRSVASVGAVVASIAMVLLLQAFTSSASAASTVYSIPGEVVVALDDDDLAHNVLVTESEVDVNPGAMSLAFIGAALPAFRQTEAVFQETPSGWARLAEAIAYAALIYAEQKVRQQNDDKYKPKRKIVITDFAGSKLVALPPTCEAEPRTVGAKTGSTVKCDIVPTTTVDDAPVEPPPLPLDPWVAYPSNYSTPALMVIGGKRSLNTIEVRQKDPLSFGARTVFGGTRNDVIKGSDYNDELIGMAGGDTILGRGGNDWIQGLQGHKDVDSIRGDGSGDMPENIGILDNDKLFGGAGTDLIMGYRGRDLIAGGPGNDDVEFRIPVSGPPSSPNYVTLPSLYGGAGNDVIQGGTGRDRMGGGADRDTILAKESDFGAQDVADYEVDCGPNLFRPVAGDEYFRISDTPPVVDPLSTCTRRIPDNQVPTRPDLLSRDQSGEWPWY